MMTYDINYINKNSDPKPGWWTAERMDYCELSEKTKEKNSMYSKYMRKYLHLLVSVFV